ncbi:MAG: PIG-L family deacetylase, partial [Cyclobacteriaceae bacterium]
MIRKRLKDLALLFLVISVDGYSQNQTPGNVAEIAHSLEKLSVLGSVLYIAAHPDDENTRLITYFANEENYRTAYLSLTRGDGGQNLIGPQLRESLGIIRTNELLAARKIDGGQQFFTRANDFGYSKTPDETFNIWDRDKILADVVWVIRKFRPDVIITRFNTTPGNTHGHHTASAILAKEAFYLAANENAFPEQLEFVDTWQAKRIFWNTSSWFYRNQEFDDSGLLTIDVGKYNYLLGKSYTEIAAHSRSQHRSQGFGAATSRGTTIDYLEQWDGPKATDDVMDDIDTDWSRLKNGKD